MPESKRRKPKGRRPKQQPRQLSSVERARLMSAMLADFCRENEQCGVSFRWQEQTYNLTYRPSGRLLQELRAAGSVRERRCAPIARLLSRSVVAWNIGCGGESLPITEENLYQGLGAGLVLRMAREIDQDFGRRIEAYTAEQTATHGHVTAGAGLARGV